MPTDARTARGRSGAPPPPRAAGAAARAAARGRARQPDRAPQRSASASSSSATSWVVKALVDATPISGPAWVSMPCGGEPPRRRAADVADRTQQGAAIARQLHRRQGVGGLAGLGDADHQHILAEQRLPVAVLRGVVDLGRQPGQALDQELPDEAGVPRGAAGDQVHPLHTAQAVGREPVVAEVDPGAVAVEVGADGVADGIGLLEDLLEHEVAEAALLDPAASQSRVSTGRSTGAPVTSTTSTPRWRISATSPFDRYTTRGCGAAAP